MKLTLRNDFHNSEAQVRVSDIPGELSPSQVDRARKALCGMSDCRCGGIRGLQFHEGFRLYLEPTWDAQGNAGLAISYVDALVAAGDIAGLVGMTTDAVQQWVKRYPAFRALSTRTSAGLIWRRADVETWLRETGRLK